MLVPVFLLALFAGDGHQTVGRIVAFVIFAVACITDRFDGLLARNYGMATEFGAFVDPIADKTLIGSALIGLSMLGRPAVVGHGGDHDPRARRSPCCGWR